VGDPEEHLAGGRRLFLLLLLLLFVEGRFGPVEHRRRDHLVADRHESRPHLDEELVHPALEDIRDGERLELAEEAAGGAGGAAAGAGGGFAEDAAQKLVDLAGAEVE
jgi:hypothetical protein